MFNSLFNKEIKNIFLTFQFQFISIVATLICVSYVFLGLNDLKLQQEDFDTASIENRNNIENLNVYSELKPIVNRRPNVLSILCKGEVYNDFTYIKISPFDTNDDFRKGISSNQYIDEMFGLDFNKIISIFLSLMALLLSYRAISEEFENGTLKLMLSNDVPRWKIITAKILSYQTAITITLAIIFLFTVIILLLSSVVDFNLQLLSRLFIIFIYYEVYLLIFVLIGCLCSIVLKKSSVSLLACLFTWLWIIIIIPSAASFIVKSLAKNDIEAIVKENVDIIKEDTNNKLAEWYRTHPVLDRAFRFGYIRFDEENHEFMTRGVRDEYKKWCADYFTFRNKVYLDNNKKIYSYNLQVEQAIDKQRVLSHKISRFSLASLLNSSVEAYTLTSFNNFLSFRNYVQLYRDRLVNYITNQNGFNSWAWFTDDKPGAEPIVKDVTNFNTENLVNDREVQYKIYMAANVSKNEKERKLNLNDVPEFTYNESTILESFHNSSGTTLVFLLLIGILFFLIVVLFNNYTLVK